MRKVGRMKGMPTKLSAVGILVGTLAAIGNGGWASAWGRVMIGWVHNFQINSAPCPYNDIGSGERNPNPPAHYTHVPWHHSHHHHHL